MHEGHGDNGHRYLRMPIADFSSNVWYGGEPAGLKEHLFSKWSLINHYPEALAGGLTRKLAFHHGLDPENILVSNGATEAIYLLAQLFRKKRSCIVFPCFSEYEDACRMHDHDLDFLPWEELSPAIRLTADHFEATSQLTAPPDLFWIGNPNNPTGAVHTGIETLIADNPQTIFAVDEAFIEFTVAISSLVGKITSYPNLVIFRSLTKAFAIPGLRLGYIAANRKLIDRLRSLKSPWSVNALALEAGNFILDHYPAPYWPLSGLLKDKSLFEQQLQQTGITSYPGHTHFILCRTPRGTAKELQQWLMQDFGLLIRDAGNFRGLDADHFRLATLSPDKNQLLINALRQC